MTFPRHQPPSEIYFPKYEALMLQARGLVDNAASAGMTLDFDTAFGHIQAFDEIMNMPVMALRSEKALVDLDEPAVFRLAETLDTVMTYGETSQRLMAASTATDIHASLLYSPAGSKQQILRGVLGISTDAHETIPEQLERRYFDGKSVDESILTVQAIIKNSRMTTSY